MEKQATVSPEYQTPGRIESSFALPILAMVMCVLQMVWHLAATAGLYFLAPNRWHFLYFDHVFLRLPVYVLVGLPAILACALTVLVFERYKPGDASRTLAIVMASIALSLAVPYLAWLFWVMVVSPPDPREAGYWI